MTYQQTIDYLYAHLPMFSRVGAVAYKEDIDNTVKLCNALGDPHTKFKTIHVAGTNGKGSTSHMLAAMLQQAGYKTGLYTSPHLKDFRERIKINGEMVSQDFVIDFVEKTKELSEKIQPSFFELTVAMAFDFFAEEKIDIAVIETGLGGRLDSTNIISPIVSVITNIGFDHMNLLGDTLEKIAYEKAGIIKPNTPVVIGEYLDETKNIFLKKAAQCNSTIYFAQDKYSVKNINNSLYNLTVDVEDNEQKICESFSLDLNGIYQIKNLRTVLCAEGILIENGFHISNQAEKFALANTKKITGLHGRWDVVAETPTIILDVAHNEDGIKQVLYQLKSTNISFSDVRFIIGMVKDKEVTKILSLLPKEAGYYFTNAHIPRALPADELQLKAQEFGIQGDYFENVNEAIAAAKKGNHNNRLIIVCGSVFLVGEVELLTL